MGVTVTSTNLLHLRSDIFLSKKFNGKNCQSSRIQIIRKSWSKNASRFLPLFTSSQMCEAKILQILLFHCRFISTKPFSLKPRQKYNFAFSFNTFFSKVIDLSPGNGYALTFYHLLLLFFCFQFHLSCKEHSSNQQSIRPLECVRMWVTQVRVLVVRFLKCHRQMKFFFWEKFSRVINSCHVFLYYNYKWNTFWLGSRAQVEIL